MRRWEDTGGVLCFRIPILTCFFSTRRKAKRNISARKVIAPLSQSLWDLHLRVSPTTRTLAECGKLHRGNIEFNISLLDNRYICGDERLFEKLRSRVLPGMVTRESRNLVQELTSLARTRHEKYGQTIFHLEPNIKDGPGGLRDYQVACWMAQIEEMGRSREWKDPEALLPAPLRSDAVKRDRLPRRGPVLPPLPPGPRLEWIDLRIAIRGCLRRNRAPGRPRGFPQ